ncbi:MAG TPA: TldD/PmbA family protein, partial [Propionibacteriaceae bacterium]|nr:TldD/PmbA family protein [Propionibacteriaceae bacterium]
MTAASLVEQALSIATLPCVVIVRERMEANLRWANNALTTNGEVRSRTITVTATASVEGGTSAGTVTRQVAGADVVPSVVAAAEQSARSGPAAEDAMPLVSGDPAVGWQDEPQTTSIDVLAGLAEELGDAFSLARAQQELLFGYAEHSVTTT